MGGYSTPVARGIKRISELLIDADKIWEGRGISNIKEVALGMQVGDINARGNSVLQKIAAGTATWVLTSAGQLKIPVWAPPGSMYRRYYPILIMSSVAVSKPSINHSIANTRSIGSPYTQTIVPSFSPAMTKNVTATKPTIDRSIATTRGPSTSKGYWLWDVLGGAVADDGGVQTVETVAANNDTLNDMTLLPAVPAAGDAYYFGYASTFPAIRVKQDTKGVGVWSIVWQYWNGAWTNLAGVNDPTNGWRPSATGTFRIYWTLPGDWALTVVQGLNLYWVRARVDAYTSVTTQPKGSRAWIQAGAG